MFVLLAAVIADSVQLADTDLWVHIRFGQIVLHTGHLLRRDIFSYSAPGAPWFNHEWLADVVMAMFYNGGGILGLKLFKFLCATAIIALLAEGTAETGAQYSLQFAVLLLAAFGLRFQIQYRPQLFDYIFLSALLVMLARDSRGRRTRLWLVVPMMALWANLHGGFFIGLAVLGLYTVVTGALDRQAGNGYRPALRLGALTSAALLATLANPFGIGEWYAVAGKFAQPLMVANRNIEFQSLFHQLANGHFAGTAFPMAIAAATMITFALTPRREGLALMAIAGLMTCAWLMAMRNMAFAVIACASPLACHLSLVIASKRRRVERAADNGSLRAPLPAVLSALVAAAFLAVSAKVFSPSLAIYAEFPVGAVAFMEQHHLSGNILSTYQWGGYLIWHAAPASKVFFDSFDERYPPRVQDDYLRLIAGDGTAEAVLQGYPHDYVLVPVRSHLYDLMTKRSDWTPVYRDSVCALFARTASSGSPALVNGIAPSSYFP